MITTDRYRLFTGDTSSGEDDVTEALTAAQELLEEFLDRPLEYDERTEHLRPDRQGRLWPRATPIVTVDDGYEIDGLAVIGGTPFFPSLGFLGSASAVEITYSGGWSRPDEETPASTILPTGLQRDLAQATFRLLHPTVATVAGILPGAESVRLGDAAVSGKRLGAGENTDAWWSTRTRGYRYQPIGTTNTPHQAVL